MLTVWKAELAQLRGRPLPVWHPRHDEWQADLLVAEAQVEALARECGLSDGERHLSGWRTVSPQLEPSARCH